MSRVLAISSQVARGHVGLSAIVPALQALGHEVIALPTVLLSNHPGHAHVAGDRIAPEQLRRMLDALSANGWLAEVDAVLTGYLPSAEHVAFAVEAIRRARKAHPRTLVLVDPILGDHPNGLYVDKHAAAAIRDSLLPLAAIVKLNVFELEWLTGARIGDERDAVLAAATLGPSAVLITSVPAQGQLSNVLVQSGEPAATCRVEHFDRVPKGTGDLFSALLLAAELAGPGSHAQCMARAVAGVDLVVRTSRAQDELNLVASLHALTSVVPLAITELG